MRIEYGDRRYHITKHHITKRCRMQKLLTIYLDNMAYMGDKWVKTSHADKHGFVEEFLQDDLKDGWKVVSLFGMGGAEGMNARGWFAVVLEK